MSNSFSYNLDQDKEIYLTSKLSFKNKFLSISACTRAGTRDGITDKLNEDAFSITNSESKLYACVLDGVSSLKPIKALGETSGARFASHYLAPLFSQVTPRINSTEKTMLELNNKLIEVVQKFKGTNIKDTHTLPATAMTLLIVDFETNTVSFSHIGDTFCIVYFRDNTSRLVTNDLIKRFDEATFRAIERIAKEKNISPKLATKDPAIREMLVKRYTEYDNRPDGTGYGELNGQKNALQYIQTEIIDLSNIHGILLGSDGVIPQGWDIENESDRQKFRQVIEKEGMEGLIKYKKSIEDSDPDFEKYTRYKHSDDATAIYIQFK